MVRITVDGSTSKSPIALECGRDAIRIVDLRKKSAESVPRRGPILTDMVNEVCRKLKKYPTQNYYFVVLLKPGGGAYAEYLTRALSKNLPGAEFAFEPILESEVCL